MPSSAASVGGCRRGFERQPLPRMGVGRHGGTARSGWAAPTARINGHRTGEDRPPRCGTRPTKQGSKHEQAGLATEVAIRTSRRPATPRRASRWLPSYVARALREMRARRICRVESKTWRPTVSCRVDASGGRRRVGAVPVCECPGVSDGSATKCRQVDAARVARAAGGACSTAEDRHQRCERRSNACSNVREGHGT